MAIIDDKSIYEIPNGRFKETLPPSPDEITDSMRLQFFIDNQWIGSREEIDTIILKLKESQ